MAKNEKSHLAIALPFLVENIRRKFWYGCRFRAGDGLSVRHQLEWFFRVRREYHWAVTDL